MTVRLALLLTATAALLASCLTVPGVSVPGVNDSPPTAAPLCRTPVGQCRINAYAAPGASCWCPTRRGSAAIGEVVLP
ncbi:hypothetical protein [Phenylobacterium ferrooxidans]|uniref:Thyroglobulin type-1 domain-containing protein n=1 Tax=Phenylobacterium ferrooxidans TaxID=2982689 RepID=A0ABW6CM98_9CAUL